MFYHQSAPATRRGYHISLSWLWSIRARVTDSDQLSSARFEPTAVLTFGLRVRRANHSATRSNVESWIGLVMLFTYKTTLSTLVQTNNSIPMPETCHSNAIGFWHCWIKTEALFLKRSLFSLFWAINRQPFAR